MPHAPGVKDKVGNIAIMIADTKSEIVEMETELAARQREIEAFIKAIPYVELRTIFRLRYLCKMTWGDVAEVFRWRYDESTLRRRIERYMAKIETESVP